MPFKQTDFWHRQENVLPGVVIETVCLWEADLHNTVADDTDVGLLGITAGCHDNPADEQVHTPSETDQNWNENARVEEGTTRDTNGATNVNVVKDFKHLAAEPRKSCNHNRGHEHDHECTRRVDLIRKHKHG